MHVILHPVVGALAAWCGAVLGAQPPDELRGTLLAALRDRLPRDGFVQCLLSRPEDGRYQAFGYDLSSGAWYEVRFGFARANLGNGALFVAGGLEGTPGGIGATERNLLIERSVMPFIWLRQIVERPAVIERLEAGPDGGLTLEFAAPLGDPTGSSTGPDSGSPPWRYRLSVSGDGRLTRSERLDVTETDVIQYVGEAAPGYPIGTIASGRWELVEASVTFPAPGEPAVTRALVEAVRARVGPMEGEARRATAMAAGHAGEPRLQPGQAPIGGAVRPVGLGRLARPLSLTGLLVVIVGAFLWWRYRRG